MTRRTPIYLLALCILVLSPGITFGWSAEAHQAIALIATKLLAGTPTADRISTILGSLTLEDIAVCPDQVRELEANEIKQLSAPCATIFPNPPKGTEPWHFVNTPIKGPTFTPAAADVTAACNKVCAVVQIQHFLQVLAAAKPTDTGGQLIADQQALSFVVHFIGDIHQPLHSADRNGDSGGNAEHVSFFGADESGELVLHAIWDNQIVARIDKTPDALASDVRPEIATAQGEPHSANPVDWTLEAYKYARDVAYKGIPPAKGKRDVAKLAQPYQDAAAPVVRIQVARAGVRLAAALNAALGSTAP